MYAIICTQKFSPLYAEKNCKNEENTASRTRGGGTIFVDWNCYYNGFGLLKES